MVTKDCRKGKTNLCVYQTVTGKYENYNLFTGIMSDKKTETYFRFVNSWKCLDMDLKNEELEFKSEFKQIKKITDNWFGN